MAWDEEYDDGHFLDEEDEMALIEAGQEGEFLPDMLREELDYEKYEEEKEEADSDDFPETFEEWKLQKELERWEREKETPDTDLSDFEA